MKTHSSSVSLLASYLLLSACVTVNVYFPASAAEDAADRFIQDVYGKSGKGSGNSGEPLPGEPATFIDSGKQAGFVVVLLDFLVPAVHAQEPDITIATPAINKLKDTMRQRHEQLRQYYENGAVGLDSNGYTQIRDESLIPLKDRNTIKRILVDENRDRDTLYKEVARANNHPEWEPNIRKIFAKRWIGNMQAGWWYQNEQGQWQQK